MNRIFYLDILKLVAALAVIMLHVSCYYCFIPNWSGDWLIGCILDSACRWCVPIFFMASGVVFIQKEEMPTNRIWIKYIPHLLIVFIIWNIFYTAGLDPLISMLKGDVIDWHFEPVELLHPYTHLWFLPVLIVMYIMVPLFKAIRDNLRLIRYMLLVWFICICISCFAPDILGVARAGWLVNYSGLFLLGYYLHRVDFTKKKRTIICIIGAISLLFTIAVTTYSKYSCGIFNQKYFEYLAPNVVVMAASIFVGFKYLPSMNPRFQKIIQALSPLQLGIYVIHFACIVLLQRPHFFQLLPNIAILQIVVVFIVTTLVSICGAWVLNKIPFVRKIIV